ncbi:MAG: MFS transporter [Chloroflexota bacterium]
MSTFAALADPRFRLLWAGSFLSFAAMQMVQVARPWLAYVVSGSATALGLVAASQGIAMLLVAPLAGVAADRLPKRTVILTSQAFLLATAAVMGVLVLTGVTQVWHLVILALVHGSTVPFNMPARQSFIPLLLPREHLANGVALQASARNVNQVLAPSVVGILLAWHPAIAFFTMVGLHVAAMLTIAGMPLGKPVAAKGRGVRGELMGGVKMAVSTSWVRTLLGMALLPVVLGFPFQQMLPVFQQEVFRVGEERLGFMYATVGVGALTGSLLVATFAGLTRRGLPQLIAGVLFGTALVCFALSPSYWFALPALAVVGVSSQSYNTINQTLLMTNVEPEYYGRMASLMMMTRSMMPLVVLPVGALVDMFGARYSLAVMGALLALAILTLGITRPALRGSRVGG